jgi:hypothetical protein
MADISAEAYRSVRGLDQESVVVIAPGFFAEVEPRGGVVAADQTLGLADRPAFHLEDVARGAAVATEKVVDLTLGLRDRRAFRIGQIDLPPYCPIGSERRQGIDPDDRGLGTLD